MKCHDYITDPFIGLSTWQGKKLESANERLFRNYLQLVGMQDLGGSDFCLILKFIGLMERGRV